LTFGGHNTYPTWSPDNKRIVFTSDREGDSALFWQRADGNGPPERLSKAEQGTTVQSDAWSMHGNVIILSVRRGGDWTLWTLSPGGGDQSPKPLIATWAANSSLSPDGQWLAYSSIETGPQEIYVQPFPPSGAKFLVSGGRNPLWSADGKQLFYLRGQGTGTSQIMAADVQTQPSFLVVKTTPLPIEGIIGETGPRNYDITPDGKFIVMVPRSQSDSDKAAPEQINISLNWIEELKQRVPVK
jgi:Tol biopolymer transport system component